MMRSKKILFITTLLFANFFCIAQKVKSENTGDKYRAVNWGLDAGLSNDWVNSMIKDINGFLWIATPFGLNRFDGSSFKKYFADKTKKNKTIAGSNINSLLEDSLHNIWIGTNKGLSFYDTRADTFRNITSDSSAETNFLFWATKDEVFCWEYPEVQLVAFNIHSFAKRILARIATTDTVGFGVSNQYAIYDVGSNSIWMEKGFRDVPGQGLLQLSLADGKRKEFTWPCYRNIPNHTHVSEGMRYDRKRNSIWISSPDGLMEFTLTNKKFHHIDALNEFVRLKDFHQWTGIDIDPEGRVWMGTYPKGIIIYDPIANSVSLPFANDSVQQNNVSDANLFLYCDKDGMVWSGYFGRKGIYQLVPFSPAVKRYFANAGKETNLPNKIIFNCINAGEGTIWMGSFDGINIFDPHTDFFNLLRLKDLKGKDLQGMKKEGESAILPLNVDTINKKAWIYIHYNEPYFEMDIATRKCRPVLYEDSNGNRMPLQSVLAHHPQTKYPIAYKNGLMIAVTLSGHQEILVVKDDDPVARKILSFHGEPIDLPSISTNDDNIFFLRRPDSTTNLTYVHHDGQWICTPTPIDSIQWSKIFYNNADQTYWIIAEVQLMHYDKNFGIIHKYTNEDGMPGVIIHGLIPDNKGNIWFNTDRSIFQLNTKTGTITSLAEKDGYLTQNLNEFSGSKDVDGDLYIVCDDSGLYRISPGKYVSSASSVYFESLVINQKTFPISAGITHVEELSLKYFENNIDLETGIIDYYSKGKGHIRYKLETEGRKADWQYAPAYYTIRYEQLPPGKYKLILQSSNAANEFNSPEKMLLINISPAFWNTWWFRTLTIIVVLGIFYLVIRYRTHQKFNLQLERSEKEREIADIKQKATELEMQALRAQMNPHFIFNSLNSINRFILQNNRLQASEYLTKFSKLVRMILQNSQASLITLESELEALGLYLEMEALRFNYHFEYKISVPKDLDIEVLKVPPLIIQPYVENAIWHGLMHKEEKGQLNIEVSQENDYLFFKITDDGIGRKKSAALPSKSATKHKSMGLRITADRIAMMQSANGNESPVTINDLANPDGSAAGTEVIIKMEMIEEV